MDIERQVLLEEPITSLSDSLSKTIFQKIHIFICDNENMMNIRRKLKKLVKGISKDYDEYSDSSDSN